MRQEWWDIFQKDLLGIYQSRVLAKRSHTAHKISASTPWLMCLRENVLHVMNYTLRTWKQELIAIFECFPLDKFYMLKDKLLLAKKTKNKQKGPIDIYI